MEKRNSDVMQVIVAVILEFCILLAIVMFQNNILMSFPLVARAILMIALQWILLIVPAVFMRKSGEGLRDIGFSKNNIICQILNGIIIAIIMCLVFTVFPILVGRKDMVGSSCFTHVWQFCYEFAYMLLGIALVEEFFYRGFLFKKLMNIRNSKWFAIVISSVIFGISHIIQGNVIQAITTSLLGIFFCVCRDKIKNCSTLSLILAHGIHNALITVFVVIL